ncbi:hypothetical protein [Kitasatospora indigofera]|uniref:hypothetical protein n=1 Tax=Kitasatospora indigofera TaxID=67307 RepID=UPI0033BDEF7C
MARNDRRADSRSALTGETYQQALTWIQTHGLTAGPVPEAATAAQQTLEAAVLRSLARPPLDIDDSMFGIARVTPDVDTITLWPAPGTASRVLARVLPAITAGTRTGVPALRAAPESAKYLTLRTDGTARVLVRATTADHTAARALIADLGGQLLDDEPSADERALWQRWRTELATEASQWSTALRRTGLFLRQRPDWTRRVPAGAETDVPAELTAPRPHGPTVPKRATATIAVTADRGGEGCSTVALALTLELARAGSSVLLLTADQFAHEALQRGGRVTPWPASPSGSALTPGSVSGAYWDQSTDTELVVLGRQQADIVVLDTHLHYRPGTGAVDVEVNVARYRDDHWYGRSTDDHRPREIRLLEWLEQQFTHFRNAAHQEIPADERALLDLHAYLDHRFHRHAIERAEDGDHPVYDRADPESVDDFWAMYYRLDKRGDTLPPAEDQIPLDEWRAQFLAFIDADGRRRHPDLWAQVTEQWAERNRRRNLQHLTPFETDAADTHRLLEEFLPAVASAGLERWGAGFPAESDAYRDAVIHRWLEQRCDAYLTTRPRPAPDAWAHLMLVLDARFADYAEARHETHDLDADPFHDLPVQSGGAEEHTTEPVYGRELDDTGAMDDWWSPAASAALYSRAPEEDQAPLDAWRQEFLQQIDTEGARRHPGLWPRARSEWAQRNRHRNLLELEATDAEADDLERWTAQFPDAIAPIADEVWGPRWRTVSEVWREGQGPLLDTLHDFDSQVAVVPVPRTPEETAKLLLARTRGPRGRRVLVVNTAPHDLDPERVREVSRLLRGHGIEALAAVADSGSMRSLLFDRAAGDRQPQGDVESLARVVAAAAARSRSV